MPTYPKYIRGTLSLYFDNGERAGLQPYSEDLREPMAVASVPVPHREVAQNPEAIYLLNGRMVGGKPYASLRPQAGNCIIIHDTKRTQPVISGVRRYNGR